MKKTILSIFAVVAMSGAAMANNVEKLENNNITKTEENKIEQTEVVLVIDCVDVYHSTYHTVANQMHLGSEIGELFADLAYDQCMSKKGIE